MNCQSCGARLLLERPNRTICERCRVGSPTAVAVRTPITMPPRIWPGSEDVVVEAPPHPEPIVRAQPAEEHEVPDGAKALIKIAVEHGWTWFATYARGTDPKHAAGRPMQIKDSIVVRFCRRPDYAFGIWTDGSFDCALAPVGYGGNFAKVNSTELRAFLAGDKS